MIKRYFCFLLLVLLVSCAPTSWLKLDVLNPAVFTFPDTGKISILNASYLPSALPNKSNLIAQIPSNEQFIFDTLITTNLFNGFFSVINESPIENLRNAEYEEIRTIDTTNFTGPLSTDGVTFLCKTLDSRFLISFEYYEFNRKETRASSYDYGWQFNLEIPYGLIWRIYGNDGLLIDQFIDTDTLYWYEDINTNSLPELPDALREAFYFAGEKFAKHISPNWTVISRQYYLISKAGDDISLEREQLVNLPSGKRRKLAFKACYNLAVLSESEDKLQESIEWLEQAKSIIPSAAVELYRKKLEKRLLIRKKLDLQSGKNINNL